MDFEFLGSGKDLVPFRRNEITIPYAGTCYAYKHPRWQPVWDAWTTSIGGEIRVGIKKVEGSPADECTPIVRDHAPVAVHWKGDSDIRTPPGQEVVLHFGLAMVNLFSVAWI